VLNADSGDMPATNCSPIGAKIGWATLLAAAAATLGLLSPAPARAAAATPVIETIITAGPADEAVIEDDNTSFSFTATSDGLPLPGATFRCSVDSAPAQSCASPLTLDELEEGPHSFSVFAEDPAHFTADPEPASRSFSVAVEEGCEEAVDEEGLPEEDEECDEDGETLPPEECLLRTARARVLTYTAQGRIRLVIRYTAFSPAEVRVGYRLSGARGGLRLRTARRRLAERGLFRLDQSLRANGIEKVRAARRFTVIMHIAATPRYCLRYDTRHLTIRRIVHSQVVWFQSDSIFGTRP
jgi:hypothetical protein